jgi:hypothetical protein
LLYSKSASKPNPLANSARIPARVSIQGKVKPNLNVNRTQTPLANLQKKGFDFQRISTVSKKSGNKKSEVDTVTDFVTPNSKLGGISRRNTMPGTKRNPLSNI